MNSLRNLVKRLFLALPPALQKVLIQKLHPQYGWLSRITRTKVVTGPFQGMRYIYRSVGSSWFPKVLGTYEKELWPVVEQAIQSHINR
jgi:hypothetical protein